MLNIIAAVIGRDLKLAMRRQADIVSALSDVPADTDMFLRMQNMLTDNYSQLIMVIVCMRCGTARTSCS